MVHPAASQHSRPLQRQWHLAAFFFQSCMRLPPFIQRILIFGIALHFYVGWRLLPDLHMPWQGVLIGGVLLLLLCVGQPMGLLSRNFKQEGLADRVAWIAFLSMGFFSSLFVFTILRDLGLLILAGWNYTGGTQMDMTLIQHESAIAVIAIALFISVVGFYNARKLARVVEVDVPITELDASLEGFTLVQISDLHVGPTIKRPYIERIVRAVNALQPDVIAVTGDLVDGSPAHLHHDIAPLARLSARHGAFVITGNHEYYAGAQRWRAEFDKLGLVRLDNRHVVIEHKGAAVQLAGVSDWSAGGHDSQDRSDPKRAIANGPAHAVRVLLAHQPRTAPAASEAGFDLQLSGHTHGGQFFPWMFFVRMQQPFRAGLHRVSTMWVYVSRGTGYWGPPLRFGAPSEITRLRLVKA